MLSHLLTMPNDSADIFLLHIDKCIPDVNCFAVMDGDSLAYYVVNGMPLSGAWPADGHRKIKREDLGLFESSDECHRFRTFDDAQWYARTRTFSAFAIVDDFRRSLVGTNPLSEVPEDKKLASASLDEIREALHVGSVGGGSRLDEPNEFSAERLVEGVFESDGRPYNLDLVVDCRKERYAVFHTPFGPLSQSLVITKVGDNGPRELFSNDRYSSLIYCDLIDGLDTENELVFAGCNAAAFIQDRPALIKHVVLTLSRADQKILHEISRSRSPYERAQAAACFAQSSGKAGVDTSYIRR